MHNISHVDSIATAIFLAGEERLACPQSKFLFHGIRFNVEKMSFNIKDLKEAASNIGELESMLADIVTERTQISRDEMLSLCAQGEAKDVAFAKSKGIVNEIKAASIPKGSIFYTLNTP